MAIQLPTLPYPWKVTPRLVDFGVDAVPVLGGIQQRVARVGSRWAFDLTDMPALKERDARNLWAALIKARAQGSTVIMPWPSPLNRDGVGTPLVNGANQTGTSLVIDGAGARNPNFKAGRFFSVVVSGRSYLYCLTDDATSDGSGNATLNFSPMLRASPADNTALEFYNPQIEGFIQGASETWTVERLTWASFSFTIQEAA